MTNTGTIQYEIVEADLTTMDQERVRRHIWSVTYITSVGGLQLPLKVILDDVVAVGYLFIQCRISSIRLQPKQ